MPGVRSYGFFSFFSNSKKSILSQKKKQNTKSWISPPSQPQRGRELNVGLTRLPLPLWNRFERWPVASVSGYNLNTTRSETNLIFFGGVRHTCVFSLRRELQEKSNTGWKDSNKYQDKNTCAFAQHPCHPMWCTSLEVFVTTIFRTERKVVSQQKNPFVASCWKKFSVYPK